MSQNSRFLFLFFIPLGFLFQCDQSDQEEIVSIPDTGFLHALLEEGVDKNGDGLISFPEAEATISIRLPPSGISDLSGLEAFVKLDSLMILMNPISNLDLSANISLKYLSCTGCELIQLDVIHNPHLRHLDCSGGASMSNVLTHVDLSMNPALETLYCSENRLTSLDLSKNPTLREVNCGRNLIETLDVSHNSSLIKLMVNNNRLTGMDVSNNTSLIKLITCGNQLSSLNVSGNTNIVILGVDNMATIYEVCVWTAPFPPPGVILLSDYSPSVYFTTSCNQ